MTTLRFIFGDQLNFNISSLRDANKSSDKIFLCEVVEEASAIKHHQKKLVFIFSAMRHFASELKAKGFDVDYVKLDDKANTQCFANEIQRAIKRHKVKKLIVTEPSEYRVIELVKTWKQRLEVDLEVREDDRFYCQPSEFKQWLSSYKQPRMEYFYRYLRQKHNILMDDDKPIGGQWNFDQDNRKSLKSASELLRPKFCRPNTVTQEVMELVRNRFADHFGNIEPFHFAVTRKQALQVLNDFIDNRLPSYGDYQDAMLENQPWMFHAVIGLYLNIGLLLPQECITKAEQAYQHGKAPINAVEGFIRQILGWREYVRSIYWNYMPKYRDVNFLQAKAKLPKFYWTGDTSMNCLRQCVKETKENAYAHHIQRLMVLGNFAMLAGVKPGDLNEWYWIVYADAYEWVELPNVSGMVLFADGGILASKPYISGGAYINRMSNYCQGCQFNVKEKTGDKACPFNYLYWNFLMMHEMKLSHNPRLAMMYRTLNKMDDEAKAAVKSSAKKLLQSLG